MKSPLGSLRRVLVGCVSKEFAVELYGVLKLQMLCQ